jgi:pimeloyl-ACP methyl ester carboxylesterase
MTWFKKRDDVKESSERLYVETHGAGDEQLVFLAGLGGTTRYWSTGVKSFESSYSVTLIDLLGFGRSPKPWTRYSVERHVTALHDVLSERGKVTLVGHSLGALIAIAYAAKYPSQVEELILISLPYFGSKDKAYEYFRGGTVRGGFLFTNVLLTMLTCILTRRVFGRLLPYFVRDLPGEVVKDLVQHTWRSSTSSLWEVVYRYDASADFRSLPKLFDVHFIHGDMDTTAPVEGVKVIAASRPNWELILLKGADHHPFLRETQKCIDLITRILSNSRSKNTR